METRITPNSCRTGSSRFLKRTSRQTLLETFQDVLSLRYAFSSATIEPWTLPTIKCGCVPTRLSFCMWTFHLVSVRLLLYFAVMKPWPKATIWLLLWVRIHVQVCIKWTKIRTAYNFYFSHYIIFLVFQLFKNQIFLKHLEQLME